MVKEKSMEQRLKEAYRNMKNCLIPMGYIWDANELERLIIYNTGIMDELEQLRRLAFFSGFELNEDDFYLSGNSQEKDNHI